MKYAVLLALWGHLSSQTGQYDRYKHIECRDYCAELGNMWVRYTFNACVRADPCAVDAITALAERKYKQCLQCCGGALIECCGELPITFYTEVDTFITEHNLNDVIEGGQCVLRETNKILNQFGFILKKAHRNTHTCEQVYAQCANFVEKNNLLFGNTLVGLSSTLAELEKLAKKDKEYTDFKQQMLETSNRIDTNFMKTYTVFIENCPTYTTKMNNLIQNFGNLE